jgi:RHS repeat-associated protein
MIALGDLHDAIDPSTGTLRLSVPLAMLPDTVGPPFGLAAAYASPVAPEIYGWNLSAPTGVLGLGWSLGLMRIVALRPVDTSVAGAAYYLESGAAVIALARLATGPDGGETYGRIDGAFWKITFYRAAQRWVLIDENGIRFTFGGFGTANPVATCVAWDNWIGASTVVAGQASVATAWRLAQIEDLWGNVTEFDYRQVAGTVGSGVDTYTQATYLDTVTGSSGGRLILNYDDKPAAEYQPAHTTPEPNAWQDPYETKLLRSISVVSPAGATLRTIAFTYGTLGTGNWTKPLLTGVQLIPPAGRASPGVNFVYGTTGAGSDPSYGQLVQVTTPEGGVANVSYAAVSPALSNRSMSLLAPTGGKAFANPALSLGEDYAVAVWRAIDSSQCAVTTATWDGRWVPTPLATVTASATSVVQTATAGESFAVRVDAQLVPYRRDPRMAGAWVGPVTAFPLALAGSEAAATACTDGAAAVLGLTSLKLTAATWTGSDWSARAAATLAGGGQSPVAALAANDACLVAAVTDGGDPAAAMTAYLMGTDATRQWWSSSVGIARPSAAIDTLTVAVGPTFAVIRASGLAGGWRVVTFDLVDWAGPSPRTHRLTQLFVATAAQLPAAVIHGASIAIGQLLFRYDGRQWGTQDVGSIVPAGAATLSSFSPGVDIVVRGFAASAVGSVFDVVAYDPNAVDPTAAWSSVLSGTLPGDAYTARAAVARNQASNYVVFARPAGQGGNAQPANAVYYRMPNAQWSHALDIPETLTPAECASLQVVGEAYLVYQSGTTVIAYPLASGGVTAAARTSLPAQNLLVPNADPATLLAPRFFATYAGTWGQNPTISLHRVTPSGADKVQPLVAVSRIRYLSGNTVDPTTGYAALDATPTYTTGSAVANPAGTFARFNRMSLAVTSVATGQGSGSVQVEMFNGLAAAEAAALASGIQPNYPTGATNAAQFTRLLMTTPYRATQSWAAPDNSPQNNVNTTWLDVTVRHFLAPGSPEGDPIGFAARATRSEGVNDGVTTTVAIALNANLLPQTMSGSRFDGNGNLETLTTTLTYFPDQYANGPDNLLTPVIQSVSATNGSAVAAQVTTWSATWGTAVGKWAPCAAYVATAASFAAFTAWSGGAAPAGWLNTETITARNAAGAATTGVDALARTTFTLFDRNNAVIVARFVNATAAEASYYGFEPYERNPSWAYLGSSSIESHVTQAQYHTGTRSLEIDPDGGAQTGPIASFLHTADGDSYLFSCWMLVPQGFVPDATKARWTLQLYTTGASPRAVGDPVVLAFPAPSAAWQYLQAVVDLAHIRAAAGVAANTPVSVTILGCDNRAASVAVHADELCFRPLDSAFSANVFDAVNGLVTATLDENGATSRPIYDGGQRTVALVGPGEENVAWISLVAYARTMSPDGSFQPAFPNQVLGVRSASFGSYQDFDASDASRWTLPASWAIAGNQLAFAGTSTDAIGSRAELTGFVNSDYAALVRVPTTPGAATTVSIGTGDVFVSWVPGGNAGTWVLQRQVSGTWTTLASHADGYAETWLFAVVDNVLFFFADGAQIFGWRAGAPTQGKLQLAAKGPAAFEQLVIAVDPSLAVTFLDGAAEMLATMAMVDNQTVQVTGQLFDPLGRPAYARNPVRQSIVLGVPALGAGTTTPDTGLDQGALTTYLPYKPNNQQMTIAEYTNPAISDAPYVQTVFEASPLCRQIEVGAPGAQFAVGSGHTTRLAYGANAASSWLSRVLAPNAPGLAAGSYFRTSVISPDGNLIESITNAAGQIIARALTPAGAVSPTSIESFLYDGAGRQVAHRQPNYYFPPPHSGAATWQLTATYDFTGNLTQTTDPDAGVTRFLSDRIGRPRFVMDAAAAALAPPVIRYVRYDALDRIIERGTVSAAGLTWDGLAAHVDDPSWPAAQDGAVWARRYVYDRPDTAGAYDPQPANLVGNLAQLKVNATGTASPAAAAVDAYAFAYDLRGNVIEQNSYVPGFDTTTRQTQFGWDNIERPIEITYPRALDPATGRPAGPAVNVTYFYDRIGRMAGIGTAPEGTEVLDPSNPNPGPLARYAYYQYDASGRVQNVTHALNSGGAVVRSASYDAGGRPLLIGGDYFSQSFTYGTGGLAGASNWSGRATSATTRYAAKAGPTDDPASGLLGTRTWLYRYDGAGRLTGAVASDANTDASLAAGTAMTPITYDANGALLSVPGTPTTESYSYDTESPPQRTSDRVQYVAVDVNASLDFSTTLPAGWTSGASNLGPSTSQIVSSGSDAPYFQLGGGSLGHYEYLQFTGVLGPAETYTLTVQWRAPAPFGAQAGGASCDLVLAPAQGVPYRQRLQNFSAGADSWQQAAITIDMAQAVAAAGLPGAVVSVTLQFTNAKRDAGGRSGAPLQIKSLTLARAATSPTPASYQYDAAGRMTRSPPRQINAIGYDPMSGRVATLSFANGQPVASVAFTRGPGDAVATRTITYPDNTTLKVLEVRAPGGGLLAVETAGSSGGATRTLYLRDVTGTFATLPATPGDPELYQLRDALGSLRAVAAAGDGPTAGLRQRIDYGPFGQPILSAGVSPTDERFTGQPFDAASGLGDFGARFYDPQLRGFLAPDNARETANAYAYAGGDPVNFSDPSGNIALARALEYGRVAGWFLFQGHRAYGLYESGFVSYAWENPGSAALDVGELVGAAAASSITLAMLTPVLGPWIGIYATAVHSVLPHSIPVVSMTIGVLSGVYSAAAYGVVRTISERLRGTRDSLTVGDLRDAAISYGRAALPAASFDTFYQHFLAPHIMFPYRQGGAWRFVRSPHRRFGFAFTTTPGNAAIFRLSDGTYAFEEYAATGGYTLPFLQYGNANMGRDTNRALMQSMPTHYFGFGYRYGNPAYVATGLVLEHRVQAGYYLFLQHAIHTPSRGGPAHLGISAFIAHGVQYQWMAGRWTQRAMDNLRTRQSANMTVIAEEGVGPGEEEDWEKDWLVRFVRWYFGQGF